MPSCSASICSLWKKPLLIVIYTEIHLPQKLYLFRYKEDEIELKVSEFRKMLLEKQGLDKEKKAPVKIG